MDYQQDRNKAGLRRRSTGAAIMRHPLQIKRNWSVCGSNPVDENEQTQPDDIHKVPVPRYSLKGKVMLGRKMTHDASDQYDDQHNRPECHV